MKVFVILAAASAAYFVAVSAAMAGLNTYTRGNTIYIQNTGGQGFYWTMCIRTNGRGWADTPNGYTGPYSTSQYGVYTDDGFRYWVNTNTGRYPQAPNC